jgi:hypothetical protein
MVFTLRDYYEALNGESSLARDTWHVNYDKRHVFKISSDQDVLDGSNDAITLAPSSEETLLVQKFSDQTGQKVKNTKIVSQDDGTEEIQLELEDRIITIVMDQSGSMTWSDSGNLRHQVAEELISKIAENYPGDVSYNLVTFGGTLVNVLFFGLIEEEGVDVTDLDSVASLILADEDANFAGVRVMRSTTGYPSEYGGLDGEEVADGFISRVLDEDLTEGQTVYYRVFTYDKNGKVSHGTKIKVIPRDRVVPRGISIFRTAAKTDDLTEGRAYIGRGVRRDEHTIGLWHMDEGEGRYTFDFSDSGVNLYNQNPSPAWYDARYVPVGTSGLIFDGRRDYLTAEDTNNAFEVTWDTGNSEMTIAAWIYPIPTGGEQYIFCRYYGIGYNYLFTLLSDGSLCLDGGPFVLAYSSIKVEYYKWQYIAVTCDGISTTYYINDTSEEVASAVGSYSEVGTHHIVIGADLNGSSLFKGGIAEVSVHNTVRSASYLAAQLDTNDVHDSEGNVVDTETVGFKVDNGDRLVVLKYEIPSDYNFSGGQVRIVRNDKRIPSWEEDIVDSAIVGDITIGKVVHEAAASVGVHYVTDPDDFVLGETYYYRIFSQNSQGNYSFSDDSPSLTVPIQEAEEAASLPDLTSAISGPQSPSGGQPSITAGNKKIYLRWENPDPSDTRVKRVRIYYSLSSPPVISSMGTSANLLYTGAANEKIFVHRGLKNDVTYYYTIVFVDKYGRTSNHGVNSVLAEDLFQLSATPSSSADEGIIPLDDVTNVAYELVDGESVSIKWDQPVRNPTDIDAYFDQTVLLYSSVTDQFGSAISSDTPIKMSVNASIVRESQADDVFGGGAKVTFEDKDAYDFFVTRTDEGVVKAILKMTSNTDIISQIRSATFDVQLKVYIPKEGGAATPANSTTGGGIGSLEEYGRAIEDLIGEMEGASPTTSSDNVFEYYSRKVTVSFTNPWEIELVNRDNLKVSERCYVRKEDPYTKRPYLMTSDQRFNGVYMGASTPFVVRAKVKYKGQPVEAGQLQVAVWDADFNSLCRNAGVEGATPYEGEKIKVSTTVLSPQETIQIRQGTEERAGADGSVENVTISYADIPLYAPSKPHAVRLYVKGSNAGYSSAKDMYILFQSLLKIEWGHIERFQIDGKNTQEQIVNLLVINPDYPNYRTNSYDRSLATYPSDSTIVEWKLQPVQGSARSIYSIDSVPLTNGVYSYTRNGCARNIFFGPVGTDVSIDEIHEISARVVYQGMVATAKRYIELEHDPQQVERTGARFLMENDGGYLSSGRWGGGGWLRAEESPMWADGEDYRRIKIHRNPRVATGFRADAAFRACVGATESGLIELSSGQIVTIATDTTGMEIVHGEVSEVLDPYEDEYQLEIGQEGFAESDSANIKLNDAEKSDITYFYIRANKFVPNAKSQWDTECDREEEINPCLGLKTGTPPGIKECDLPQWTEVVYVSGTTTVFVNNQPLVLTGGGGMRTGIPPIPITLKEPLGIATKWRKVINYYYQSPGTEGSDALASQEIEVGNDQFLDSDGDSYIHYTSDVVVRVEVTWKGNPVPDGTPVYVKVGSGDLNTLFIPDRNSYTTVTDSTDGYSYVDVTLRARRVPTATTTETVEVYCTYDKKAVTSRKMSVSYSLTIEYSEAPIDETPDEGVIVEPVEVPATPYTDGVQKYNIDENSWGTASGMSEGKGDIFAGAIGDCIYVAGGLKSNSFDISGKTEKYDVQADLWSIVKNITTPRFAGMSVVYDGKLYAIGGIGKDPDTREVNVLRAVEVYDPSSDSWEVKESMPLLDHGSWTEKMGVAFGSASLVVVEDKPYIYVLSGVSDFQLSGTYQIGRYNDRILRYSIDDDEWSYSEILRSDELPIYRRISPLSIVFDNSIIVFGGAIESGDTFVYPADVFKVPVEESFAKVVGEVWLTSGSSHFGQQPVPKFQAALAGYEVNPSDQWGDYFIVGGANSNASSLDLVEKVSTTSSPFGYESSYDVDQPSDSLTSMAIAVHGASAVCSMAPNDGGSMNSPHIFVIGGYTTAHDSSHVDISFDL